MEIKENIVTIKEADLAIVRDMQAQIDEYWRFTEYLLLLLDGDYNRRTVKFDEDAIPFAHAINCKLSELIKKVNCADSEELRVLKIKIAKFNNTRHFWERKFDCK